MNGVHPAVWWILLCALTWVVLAFCLVGCEVSARRERLFGPVVVAPAIAPQVAAADDEPELRLLEDYNGRLRLLARDPFTRRFRVVR